MALPDVIVMIKYLVIRHIAKQKKNINCELFSKQSILLLLSFLKQISFHTKVQIQVHCIHQINTSKH